MKEPGEDPVKIFAAHFNLCYKESGIMPFNAVVNFCVKGKMHKIETAAELRASQDSPLAIIRLLNPAIAQLKLPNVFNKDTDMFHFMSQQFLMIMGYSENYGNYHVLIYPGLARNQFNMHNIR